MNKVPYEDHLPNCSDCKVSHGSYAPFKIVRDEIVQYVQMLQTAYPDYAIKVTGHSLGANWAQLMSMYLLSRDIKVDHMINFGQMRVGNEAYAAYSDEIFANQFRVVHHKDCIPHSPLRKLGYHHQATEMYEDVNGNIKQCDGSGEDPTCGDQWKHQDLYCDDHNYYLG